MDIKHQSQQHNLKPQYSSTAPHVNNTANTGRWTCNEGDNALGKKNICNKTFAPTHHQKSIKTYNPQAAKLSPHFLQSAEKTPHLEQVKPLGMMMSEVEKTAQAKKSEKSKEHEPPAKQKQANDIGRSHSEIDASFENNFMLNWPDEAPDEAYRNFNNTISKMEKMINNGKEQEAIEELKKLFHDSAFKFVSPAKENASKPFTEYIRRLHQLNKDMTASMKAKKEIVRYAIDEMTACMNFLTTDVMTACISEAFSNPTFTDALEKCESDTDTSILRRLQELSAFNFMKNEINTLAQNSGVSVSCAPDGKDPDRDSDTNKPASVNNNTNGLAASNIKNAPETPKIHNRQNNPEADQNSLSDKLAKLKDKRKKEIMEGMEEFDNIMENGAEYIKELKKKTQETAAKPKLAFSTPDTPKAKEKPTPIAKKPSTATEKPKTYGRAGPAKVYPCIEDIYQLNDDMAIADAVLKLVANCPDENKRKELDTFLKKYCTKKAEAVIGDLNKVTTVAMKPSECIRKLSETVGYRQIAETIAPPSARKLSEITENEKAFNKDGNIDGTILHLLKQSVVFPINRDVKGDPAKWTREEFLAEFEKIASMYKENQRQCVRRYPDDMLKLFKLKQYPFMWGYDKERQATPPDQDFEVMAKTLYDKFIGKPLCDARDCKRLEIFTDQQRHHFLEALFGPTVTTELKQIIAEGAKTRTPLPTGSIERARVSHIDRMVLALLNDRKKGEFYLTIGKRTEEGGQAFPVKVLNQLAIDCFNQQKGSNFIFKEMGSNPISDGHKTVR